MAKHYIRLNENKIIKGFTDEFEKPVDGDICINENGGRQFVLNEKVNPPLFNEELISLYKYELGLVIELTEEEIQEEIAKLPPQQKTELEMLRETIDMLVLNMLGGI